MGTKNEPGEFDCYASADPDEPMFILLGRDPFAAQLVEAWVDARIAAGDSHERTKEAAECANAMRLWLERINRQDAPRVVSVDESILDADMLRRLKGR